MLRVAHLHACIAIGQVYMSYIYQQYNAYVEVIPNSRTLYMLTPWSIQKFDANYRYTCIGILSIQMFNIVASKLYT